MDYDAILERVLALLQGEKRLSYRVLKRRLQLDDDLLEDLKEDLIYAKQLAVDEAGKVLVWVGKAAPQRAPPRQVGAPSLSPSALEAERRQLTVLFCDLVDSTALANQLDPEELREVVRAYQATCAAVIQRYEGHIAQYLGDGLLVYFGYPQAHEDDAQRSVRTGLEIVEAMGQLNTRLQQDRGIQLAVRVGIHTGVVVVGDVGGGGARQERLALGDTPNMAARIQGLAAPNTVTISTATQRLVQGFFTAADLGTHMLKGVATPLQVYRVLQESTAQTRLDVAATRGLTPLVGRESQVTLLLERWAQVKDGMGQVVVLNGEAGIGKSRLAQVLKVHLAGEPHARLEWRGSSYHQHSALHPVIDHLHRLLRWRPEEGSHEKLQKLEETIEPYGLALSEVVPLLAALLSLPLPERYPPPTLTPQRQKQKTLEALLAWLLEEAKRQMVLLVVEDLHWVDPSTLELIGLLIDQTPTARLFILLTCRPEFRPPWASRSYLTQITLARLPRHQAEVMVERMAGGKMLPAEVRQQVVAKTDGVPLFVEELTKMVLESGLLREREDHYELTGPLPPLAIPATLHDSLLARLDRLAIVREVAQLGATLGREFSYELLQAVSSVDEVRLQQALAKLVEAEVLYQRGLPPQARYLFKHALIQDAAYQSLLKSTRQHYHRQIAQVLAERFPQTVETQPELLAHHYTEAGLIEPALPYWQQAGQRATQRSANAEALSHLTTALELLKALPDTPERTQQELALQSAIGIPLVATKGQASPEVAKVYARAQELCQQVGEMPQLFPILYGLFRFYFVRGQHQTAREITEQLLSLAQREQDPALLLEAHRGLGNVACMLGEWTLARTHQERGIALYDFQQHDSHAFLYGQDPGIMCLSSVAPVLWNLGYPDQALKRSHEALTLAQQRSHPHNLVLALDFAGWLHSLRREGQGAQERAGVAIRLSTEQGFAQWWAFGTILQGWTLAAEGQKEEGIAQIYQGLVAYRATGAELWRPYFLALLAEACGKVDRVQEGLSVLAEALAIVDKNGERSCEAELYRIKGELTLKSQVNSLQSKAEEEAEECFQQALTIARRQRAKSPELRAVMNLSRLWQQQGKQGEAQQQLAEIYGWFTEGFDTADLQEAKALLEALS